MSSAFTRNRRSISKTRRLTQTAVAAAIATFMVYLIAGSAASQHEGAANAAPPPPSGDATLHVQITHAAGAAGAERTAGLDLALYALDPNGQPGFASGSTDATGRFTFEGISNDPAIIYLVGVRYREIPFGERITFGENAATADVTIKISDPTDQIGAVKVEELRTRVDWMGDRVVVREILKLRNPSDKVVLLPAEDPKRAITIRPLTEAAKDFAPGPTSIGDGVGFVDGKVLFWGPLYPGEQSVEYQYSLPVTGLDASLRVGMREPIARVVVVAGTQGLGIAGDGLIGSSDVSGDRGQRLAAWARDDLAAGEALDVTLALPETRKDPALIRAPRTDIWLDIDDAQLTAKVDLSLVVEPGAPVSGSPDAPLFHVSIPKGATLNGVAPESEALGLIPTEDGGFDVVGPVGPGAVSLSYSYRLPAGADGASLDLRFPREISTLNVLIADTEVKVESSRLHRRRPFRSGTRNFLHREAYNVAATEVVDLKLTPLVSNAIPRNVILGLTIASAAAGIFFMVSPLRRVTQTATLGEDDVTPIRRDRENIYVAIQDLDHDFETGKLERTDYESMRDGLRTRAIDLLREERKLAAGDVDANVESGGEVAVNGDEPESRPVAPASTSAALGAAITAAPSMSTPTSRFCPSCGQRVDPSWKFCSHCGGELAPAPARVRAGEKSG